MTAVGYIDEERDPLVLVNMLLSTTRSIERFFTRPGADWGRDLADPGKRGAIVNEIELVVEIFDSLARLCERIGSNALTSEDVASVRGQLNAWLRGEVDAEAFEPPLPGRRLVVPR